jgi:hypothetical protein
MIYAAIIAPRMLGVTGAGTLARLWFDPGFDQCCSSWTSSYKMLLGAFCIDLF